MNLPSKLDGIIGEGASAIVYQHCLSTQNGQDVAIKVFKQHFLKRKIFKVYENLKRLNHPNICNILGYSLQPCSLVFECCSITLNDGEKISNVSQLMDVWNEENCFNFDERLSIIIQATEGLQYLHSKNILHKDFKPTNLLVKGMLNDVYVKLCDFDDIYIL